MIDITEKITLKKVDMFNLLKKYKFVVSKLLLVHIFEKYHESFDKKIKIPVNKSIESFLLNEFINIYKGIFSPSNVFDVTLLSISNPPILKR